MTQMTYGTISLPEAAWTGVAVLGLCISLLALFDALKTLHYLQASSQNGVRELWARGNVRNEGLRLFIHAISVTVGLVAMTSPSMNPAIPVPTLSLVLSAGLILIAVLLVVGTVVERRTRNRAIEMLVSAERRRVALNPAHIEAAAVQIMETAHQVESDAEDIRAAAVEMQTGPEEGP